MLKLIRQISIFLRCAENAVLQQEKSNVASSFGGSISKFLWLFFDASPGGLGLHIFRSMHVLHFKCTKDDFDHWQTHWLCAPIPL